MNGWRDLDAMLARAGLHVGEPTLSQTTGGVHVPTSLHYFGRARDYGRASDAAGIANYLRRYAVGDNRLLDELFYSPLDIFYKNGAPFSPSAKLRADHQDHVHAGLRTGAVIKTAFVGILAAGAVGAWFMFK